MNTTLPTIQLSADWEKFFRDEAQFYPPLDAIHDPAELEIFKRWGQGVWDAIDSYHEKELKELRDEAHDADTRIANLKRDILRVMDSRKKSDGEIFKTIRDLCS